jgi:hypothetical protein
MARRRSSIPRPSRKHCAARRIAMASGQSQKEFAVNEAHALTDALLHCAIEGEAGHPPEAPSDGECWLVSSPAAGEWAGHEGSIACRQAGLWLFIIPRDGMRIFNRSAAQDMRYCGGWHAPVTPASPSGGTTIDAEARAAIDALIETMQTAGFIP